MEDLLNTFTPEQRLWLGCLIEAVESLQERRFGDNTPEKRLAREFIFEDHFGFEAACDAVGYTTAAMRRRIKRALTATEGHHEKSIGHIAI